MATLEAVGRGPRWAARLAALLRPGPGVAPDGVPFGARAAALATDAAAIAEHATIRARLRAQENAGRARLGRAPRPLLSAETADALRVTRDALTLLLEAADAGAQRGEAAAGRGGISRPTAAAGLPDPRPLVGRQPGQRVFQERPR